MGGKDHMQSVKGFNPPALILQPTMDSPHSAFQVQTAMSSPLMIRIRSVHCTDGCRTIREQKFVQKKIKGRKVGVDALIGSHFSINCSQDSGGPTCVLAGCQARDLAG